MSRAFVSRALHVLCEKSDAPPVCGVRREGCSGVRHSDCYLAVWLMKGRIVRIDGPYGASHNVPEIDCTIIVMIIRSHESRRTS
jgi:hypothetical protein